MNRLLLGISLLLWVSCSNNKSSRNGQDQLPISFLDLAIPIDSSSLIYYKKNCIFQMKGSDFLAGYNSRKHTIDIFDLANKGTFKHIVLNQDGPNRILRIYGLFVQNLDSIFIFDPEGLKLLRGNGDVKKYTTHSEQGQLIAAAGSSIYFDEYNKSILMYFQTDGLGGSEKREKFKLPIVGEYSILTNKLNLIPIYYSKYIQENNGDFSSDVIPNLSFYQDRIITNFTIESGIYYYSRNSGLSEAFSVESSNSLNYIVPYSQDGKRDDERIITNSIFQKVYFSIDKNIYIRTHWGDQPLKGSDMEYNSMLTKPAYVMVLDSAFNVIQEFPLNRDKYFPDDSFMSEKGLYFWKDFTRFDDEDSLRLGLLRIQQ